MAVSLLVLALVGTVALAGTVAHAYLAPGAAWMRHHFLAALGSTFLLVMARSFIMFFLIATGAELKGLEKRHGWGDSFRRRTVAMKSRVFPVSTLSVFLVIANFVLGAAAHTRVLPVWAHATLAWVTLAVAFMALQREYLVLGENNRLIAEAASRGEDSPGAHSA